MFVDLSGFTTLSEKLARLGRVGAEEMADAIDGCFTELLAIAYESHGSLLKFGGDALLLLFTHDVEAPTHAERAARAAAGMRRRLRDVGKIVTEGGRVNLRMSVGLHSGVYDMFLVGGSHRELVVAGPATTEVVRMEGAAGTGQILLSPATAAALPERWVGEPAGPGRLLRSAPAAAPLPQTWVLPTMPDDLLLASVPLAVRETIVAGSGEPEHRQVAIAFVHFDGTDELMAREGAERVAGELDGLVRDVQAAVDELGVCFLASDVDADGGKLILAAGAPRAVGEDEERMLLALRRIIDVERSIQIRIGVHHGGVFAGDIGPRYRRTYTVMGDAVNLAARLMAAAPVGQVYASADVLERSATRFDTVELEPFAVKGKAKLVRAWAVGPSLGRPRDVAASAYRLVGRSTEMDQLRRALDRVRLGEVALVELVGEAGTGKSRLVEELAGEAPDFRRAGATGETYTQLIPYVAWRDVLREISGLHWEDPSPRVVARLQELASGVDPSLLPWLPLVAVAADAEMEPTPEVHELAPEFVRPKLHGAVLSFLRATVVTPTLFVFEDAHLMDEASAHLLEAIATAESSDRPWLFLVLRRPEESGFSSEGGSAIDRLSLGPLTEQDTIELAEMATEDVPLPTHLQRQVVERANGNPQLLLDLLVSATSDTGALPASVEAAATVRIDSLAPRDRQLLRRLSVFGLAFHPRFLNEVLDADVHAPDEDTWGRLAEFFEEEADGFRRFRRAVVRDAAYAGLPFRVRRRLHQAIGERWEREVDDPDEAAGLLSLHFSRAADHVKALRYATVAGEHAAGIHANVEASRFFERAFESGRKADAPPSQLRDLAGSLGDALRRAALYQDARRAYADALRLCSDDESIARAELMRKRSLVEENVGRLPQALRWLSKGRRQVDGSADPAARIELAQLDARYAAVLQAEGRNRDAIAAAERAIEAAKATGSEAAQADAENILGVAYVLLGWPGAEEHWLTALGLFERLDDRGGQGNILINLGAGAYLEGRWNKALGFYERAREAYERIGDPSGVATAQMNQAEILADQGHLDDAEVLLRQTIRVWRTNEDHYDMGFALSLLGRVASRHGRIEEARASFAQAREELRFVGAGGDVLDVDAREAECLLLAGEAAEALALADATLSAEEPEGALVPLLERTRGYALAAGGDQARARVALEAGLAASRSRGADHEAAFTLQALIRLASLEGEIPDPEWVRGSGEILSTLGIIAVPAFPLATS